MSRPRVERTADLWRELDVYRQRYQMEDRLGPLADLEKSIERRRIRSAGLTRTLETLEGEIARVRSELGTVEVEIARSRRAGALLIGDIIDRIREDEGETWSPSPIRGFRVWRIADGKVMGNQAHWPEPTLDSKCLRDVPGEDLPHSVARCGPPACGIYAVKALEMFPAEVSSGQIDRSLVGVVAMTGKVVEHELGYRAAQAEVVAAVARIGSHTLVTDDPSQVRATFEDPHGALPDLGSDVEPDPETVRGFLEAVRDKEEQWI